MCLKTDGSGKIKKTILGHNNAARFGCYFVMTDLDRYERARKNMSVNGGQSMARELNHFDREGNAVMADVSAKEVTRRAAVAEGFIRVSGAVMDAILSRAVSKGDVLGVARIAGIMAAKNTPDMIPLCHPLQLTNCTVDFEPDPGSGTVRALCAVRTNGRTGVEMEALTGVSAALLTIYDMCKALDRGMEIGGIRLLEKSGGRSGLYTADSRVEKNSLPEED
jgi:cyclic pyranopterin phosphate synthase